MNMKPEQIDKQKALRWLEGDDQMLATIKTLFIKNVPSQVDSLKMFIDAGDSSSAERVAHTIMGSSAMIGAGRMSEEACKIEQSAIENDMDSARFHLTGFVAEYEKVMSELAADGGQ